MSWNLCDGSQNDSNGFVEIQHLCYKDNKIQKVSFDSKISHNSIRTFFILFK